MEQVIEKLYNKNSYRYRPIGNKADDGLDNVREALREFAQQQVQEAVEEWYIGKKISAFGGEYVVVGLSQMTYDDDCKGEPEWKITKEIQEVAIAKEYEDISYQKPSWHKVSTLHSKRQ